MMPQAFSLQYVVTHQSEVFICKQCVLPTTNVIDENPTYTNAIDAHRHYVQHIIIGHVPHPNMWPSLQQLHISLNKEKVRKHNPIREWQESKSLRVPYNNARKQRFNKL